MDAQETDQSEIRRVIWQTKHSANPPTDDQKALFATANLALAMNRSELDLYSGKNSQLAALFFQVPQDQSKDLSTILAGYSTQLKKSPLFSKAPSALPYCFSTTPPKSGLALVHSPKRANEQTKTIVFLHGYGGLTLPTFAPIVEAFPDAIVIAPAFGISTAEISAEYIEEAIDEVRKIAGHTNSKEKPTLIGLSAGGFGGFSLFQKKSEKYNGFICLAAYPKDPISLKANGKIRILCGSEEYFVKNGTLTRSINITRNAELKTKLIPKGDHFFLLKEKAAATKILQKWVYEDF